MENAFNRKLIGMENVFYRAPEANVSLVARINGKIDERALVSALEAVQKIHPLLSAITIMDENRSVWLVSSDQTQLSLQVIERNSDDHWIRAIQNEYQIAFDFEKGPLIRFILLKSPDTSDLIIFCQHLICDGLSLANLMEEILLLMSQAALELTSETTAVLPAPENMPSTGANYLASILKTIILSGINKNWAKNRIALDQESFLSIQRAFSSQYQYQIITAALSEIETQRLVEACRRNQVTVNSAIAVAFLTGRRQVVEHYNNRILGIGVNLRNRLKQPVHKNNFGCFVSTIELKFVCKAGQDFWVHVRSFHAQFGKALGKNQDLQALRDISLIDSDLMQAMTFARHLGYLPGKFDAHPKLSKLSGKSKNIAVTLSKDGASSYPGLLITNLGALKASSHYGDLELDRLYFAPSSIPLPDAGLILGVVTVNQQLTITLNLMVNADETGEAQVLLLQKIKEQSIKNLKLHS